MSRSNGAGVITCVCMLAVLAVAPISLAAPGRGEDRDEKPAISMLNSKFLPVWARVLEGKGNQLADYAELRKIYGELAGAEQRQAAQIISMADTLYGRYSDAESHYAEAFPNGIRESCPAGAYESRAAATALDELAEKVDIFLINESHSKIATRAFVFQLLPQLRASGYRFLALEALFGEGNDYEQSYYGIRPVDGQLGKRGFPLDEGRFGIYLREPVYGEVIREAHRLGFEFVAYEPDDADSKQQREQGQANVLVALANRNPGQKIVVLAGYSHIWKTEGWMAEYLRAGTAARVLSVDQVAGLGNSCPDTEASRSQDRATTGATVVVNSDGKMLAGNPDRVDVTVYQKPESGRTFASSWLALGGRRHPVTIDPGECRNRLPCLISAHYVSEPDNAVPADRIAVFDAAETPVLFLDTGTYRLSATTESGIRVTRMLKVAGP